VLHAFRFYAVGSNQRSIGQDFLVALSQSTVSRCVRQVSIHLIRRWIKFPATPEDRQAAVRLFQRAPQPFPGAMGAIDCTHIYILKPREHEEAYVNGRTGKHTLNVQYGFDLSFNLKSSIIPFFLCCPVFCWYK
jgi:hypothetical protein